MAFDDGFGVSRDRNDGPLKYEIRDVQDKWEDIGVLRSALIETMRQVNDLHAHLTRMRAALGGVAAPQSDDEF